MKVKQGTEKLTININVPINIGTYLAALLTEMSTVLKHSQEIELFLISRKQWKILT